MNTVNDYIKPLKEIFETNANPEKKNFWGRRIFGDRPVSRLPYPGTSALDSNFKAMGI